MTPILKRVLGRAVSWLQKTLQPPSATRNRRESLETFDGMRDSMINGICQEDANEREKALAMLHVLEIDLVLFERIMALPRELRDIIYAQKFGDMPTSLIMRPHYRNMYCSREAPFPLIVPAFCYINRQIFEESLPVLFRGTSISLAYEMCEHFYIFVDQIPNDKAFKGIEKLHLSPILGMESWTQGYTNQLIRSCTNLRELTLEFSHATYYEWQSKLVDLNHVENRIPIDNKSLSRRCVPFALFECERLQLLRLKLGVGLYWPSSIEGIFRRLVDIYRKLMEERKSRFLLDNDVYEVVWVPGRTTTPFETQHRAGYGWSEGE